MPFLAGNDLHDAVTALIEKATELGIAQDKRFEGIKARVFGTDEGGDHTKSLSQNLESLMRWGRIITCQKVDMNIIS